MDSRSQQSRRRLKVFEEIAESGSQVVTRGLELRSSASLEFLAYLLSASGDLLHLDSSSARYGRLVAIYFDVRSAMAAGQSLSSSCEVRFLPLAVLEGVVDYVFVLPSEVEFLRVFADCISSIESSTVYLLVKFYDTRIARRAHLELYHEEEEEGEFFENEFHDNSFCEGDGNASMNSESTAPSPYVYSLSSFSPGSREGQNEELKKPRKNPVGDTERHRFTIQLARVLSGEDLRTTIMIRNLPNKYSQNMLLESIDRKLPYTYDFFYLPIDFHVTYI